MCPMSDQGVENRYYNFSSSQPNNKDHSYHNQKNIPISDINEMNRAEENINAVTKLSSSVMPNKVEGKDKTNMPSA